MITLLYVSITGYNFSCLIAGSNFMNTFCVAIAIIVVAPLLYLVFTAIVGCCLTEFFTTVLCRRFQSRNDGYDSILSDESDMPHRLLNPSLYNAYIP